MATNQQNQPLTVRFYNTKGAKDVLQQFGRLFIVPLDQTVEAYYTKEGVKDFVAVMVRTPTGFKELEGVTKDNTFQSIKDKYPELTELTVIAYTANKRKNSASSASSASNNGKSDNKLAEINIGTSTSVLTNNPLNNPLIPSSTLTGEENYSSSTQETANNLSGEENYSVENSHSFAMGNHATNNNNHGLPLNTANNQSATTQNIKNEAGYNVAGSHGFSSGLISTNVNMSNVRETQPHRPFDTVSNDIKNDTIRMPSTEPRIKFYVPNEQGVGCHLKTYSKSDFASSFGDYSKFNYDHGDITDIDLDINIFDLELQSVKLKKKEL